MAQGRRALAGLGGVGIDSRLLIPELQTERLRLRGWRESDLDWWAALAADREVTRFTGGVADRAQAWRQIAISLGHWTLRGYGLWVLELRDGGAPVGRAGLWNPEGWPGIEVGWMLAPDARGRGYATEAAHAAIGFARHELGLERIISVIDPGNGPSIAVAGRLGMHHARDWNEVRIYERALADA